MDKTSYIIIENNKLEELINKVNELYNLLNIGKQQDDKLYSNRDASKYLSVCSKTLQNYRDDGLLEFRQIGRKIYYTQADLNAFLEKYKKQTFLNQIKHRK